MERRRSLFPAGAFDKLRQRLRAGWDGGGGRHAPCRVPFDALRRRLQTGWDRGGCPCSDTPLS